MMPGIFAQCMIPGDAGQSFWNKNFHKDGTFQLVVGWDKFASAFAKCIKLSSSAVNDTAMMCLKTLIGEDSRKPGGDPVVVSIQSFGSYLTQFGPLREGSADVLHRLEVCQRVTRTRTRTDAPFAHRFLFRQELALYKPKKSKTAHVFHGNITSTEAETRLSGQEKGVWLVRVSSKDPTQPFVISKVSRQGAINHQRINYERDTGTYKLDIRLKDKVLKKEATGSLVEFLKSLREDLYLKGAAPGSAYGAVFTQQALQGYLPS